VWGKSVRCRRTCCCCLPHPRTAFARLVLPFLRRETCRWACFSACSAVREWRGGSTRSPAAVIRNTVSPPALPVSRPLRGTGSVGTSAPEKDPYQSSASLLIVTVLRVPALGRDHRTAIRPIVLSTGEPFSRRTPGADLLGGARVRAVRAVEPGEAGGLPLLDAAEAGVRGLLQPREHLLHDVRLASTLLRPLRTQRLPFRFLLRARPRRHAASRGCYAAGRAGLARVRERHRGPASARSWGGFRCSCEGLRTPSASVSPGSGAAHQTRAMPARSPRSGTDQGAWRAAAASRFPKLGGETKSGVGCWWLRTHAHIIPLKRVQCKGGTSGGSHEKPASPPGVQPCGLRRALSVTLAWRSRHRRLRT
jgi:hypothetical protein